MVIWYTTTFGWTEIAFEPFLDRIVTTEFPDARLVRKCRFYSKGSKPTIAENPGLTGRALIREIVAVIQAETNHGNALPDMIVMSDDSDCRLVVDDTAHGYVYHDSRYRTDLEKLIDLVGEHSASTAVVLMLAAPEIESWFLADWKHTFRKDFSGFTLHQLNRTCGGLLPIRDMERWCQEYSGASCNNKLSEDCIAPYLEGLAHGHYSKRIHGQKYLEQIDPENVKSLKHFFAPALYAIRNQRSFVPGILH